VTTAATDRTLTFDIGGSSVKVAVIEGGVRPRIARPFPPITLGSGHIDELKGLVLSTTAAALQDVDSIDRVAISTTGIVDAEGIVTESGFIRDYAGTSWAQTLERSFPGQFGVVHVANDGDCAAWAEFVAGSGHRAESLAHFVLGTGLGGGAIVSGELVVDPPGGRGNFGHVTVPADEPATCACGKDRCAEAFAATRGVLRSAPSGVTTIRELSARVLSGDSVAMSAFETAGTWLGHAIAIVAATLKIETVTIGGGLALAARTQKENAYVDAARRTVQELTASPVQVLESHLGNDGGLLGAAGLASSDQDRVSEPNAGNVARVRTALEAFNRGDFDAALAVGVHPDVEFLPPGGQMPIRGIERFRAWMEPDAFESQVIEPRQFRSAGNKILVSQRTKARGAGSGIEVELDVWGVWTLDDAGLVTRIEIFLADQETEALRAAGLDE
jgi:glucokinase